jgi:hypothetical protein
MRRNVYDAIVVINCQVVLVVHALRRGPDPTENHLGKINLPRRLLWVRLT